MYALISFLIDRIAKQKNQARMCNFSALK